MLTGVDQQRRIERRFAHEDVVQQHLGTRHVGGDQQERGTAFQHLEVPGHRLTPLLTQVLTAFLAVVFQRTQGVGILTELNADLPDVIQHAIVRHERVGAVELDQGQRVLAFVVQLEAAVEALLCLRHHLRGGCVLPAHGGLAPQLAIGGRYPRAGCLTGGRGRAGRGRGVGRGRGFAGALG
jgi:hypothetical protein